MPKIECNKIVLGQMEIVKPELINLGTFQSFFPDAKIDILGINCQILRDWIHLHIPKHEDGNNFGVEVQEEALQELQAVKEESQSQGSTDRKGVAVTGNVTLKQSVDSWSKCYGRTCCISFGQS